MRPARRLITPSWHRHFQLDRRVNRSRTPFLGKMRWLGGKWSGQDRADCRKTGHNPQARRRRADDRRGNIAPGGRSPGQAGLLSRGCIARRQVDRDRTARRITILYHHRLLTTEFFRRHPTQLCFHEQHPEEDFEAKVAFLSPHYPVVRLADAVEAARRFLPLPEDAFVIAFDDGFEDNYDRLFPVMQRCGFRSPSSSPVSSSARKKARGFRRSSICELARVPAIHFAGSVFHSPLRPSVPPR